MTRWINSHAGRYSPWTYINWGIGRSWKAHKAIVEVNGGHICNDCINREALMAKHWSRYMDVCSGCEWRDNRFVSGYFPSGMVPDTLAF